jgi:hypothetical protein
MKIRNKYKLIKNKIIIAADNQCFKITRQIINNKLYKTHYIIKLINLRNNTVNSYHQFLYLVKCVKNQVIMG